MEIASIERLKLLQALARGVEIDKSEVRMPKHIFRDMITALLAGEFSESWYMNTYPDVAEAVTKKYFSTSLEHFATTGIVEGRVPLEVRLDEAHYTLAHKDVRRAIQSGNIQGPKAHFYASGFREGRDFKILEDDSAKNKGRLR